MNTNQQQQNYSGGWCGHLHANNVEVRASRAQQTAGQQDYERDLANRPVYHDGSPRKTWAQLGEVEQWSWNRQQTGEGTAPRIDGKHEDYMFVEGPAPIGAKCFGFDGERQFGAKLACIAYSDTIPNPERGIDVHGNYWCVSKRTSRKSLLSSKTIFDLMSVDEHLVAADAHLGAAIRIAQNEQTRECIRQAQFALDDGSTREQRD